MKQISCNFAAETKSMKPLLLSLLLLCVVALEAQEGVIPDTARYSKIREARRAVTEYFLENDMQLVRETMLYLSRDLETDSMLALFPEEKWLLWIYLEAYDSVFAGVREYDRRKVGKVAPEEDVLYDRLVENTAVNREAILKPEGKLLKLSSADRDFIPLLLDYCFLGTAYETMNQEQLNKAAELYLAKFPETSFKTFIRKYVQFILKRQRWTLGADIALSMNVVDGNMHHTFSHQAGGGFGIDLAYRKVTTCFRMNFDFGRTRDTVHFSSFTWNRHKLTNNIMAELSFGYPLRLSERIRLLPFAGMGLTSLYPRNPNRSDENPDATNPYHITAFCWVGGMSFDYRLGKPNITNAGGNKYERNSGYLRFRYSIYETRFSPSRKELNGYIHNITIGLQGFVEWFDYIYKD